MSDSNKKESKLDVKPDEQHLLLDHAYDDIQELNHPLPSWWNVTWGITIVFAIGYFVYYQFMKGPTLRDEFNQEYSKIVAIQEEFRIQNSAFNQEYYAGITNDDGVNKGLVVYENNCLPCHNENGKGDIGPNLTDDHWLIAKGTPETIYNVVFNGSEENGMPAWAELLTKDEIYQAVAYVSTFKNTFVKGGKEPQGIKIED